MFKHKLQILLLVILTYSCGYGQYLTRNGKKTSNTSEAISSFGQIASAEPIAVNSNNLNNGLTSGNASTSAYAIKQAYPSSTDGFYWIANANINDGTPFRIYADMTTDGGGWTLIMKNSNKIGWTYANAISLNTTIPFSSASDVISTSTANYSIIGWADYIKRSESGFEYMIDAEEGEYDVDLGMIPTYGVGYRYHRSTGGLFFNASVGFAPVVMPGVAFGWTF